MKDIVVLSLQADVVVAVGVAVVLDVAYRPPGKRAERILSCVLPCRDDSALERSLLQEGLLLQVVEASPVDLPSQPEVLHSVLPAFFDLTVPLVGISAGLLRKDFGKHPGLRFPGPFQGIGFLMLPEVILSYRAVHVELVHRRRKSQDLSVAPDDGASLGLYHTPDA